MTIVSTTVNLNKTITKFFLFNFIYLKGVDIQTHFYHINNNNNLQDIYGV
jgi:hypothetical protein